MRIYKWGLTTSQAYFPKDNSKKEFDNDGDRRLADPVLSG